MLIQGELVGYPNQLRKLGVERHTRIRYDWYVKTRCMEPPDYSKQRFRDPIAETQHKALAFSRAELVDRLVEAVEIESETVITVKGNRVYCDRGTLLFDYCCSTIPLWDAQRVFRDLNLPDSIVVPQTIYRVETERNNFARFDHVYTPYTPGDAVNSVAWRDGSYIAEVSGKHAEQAIIEDLNFLFEGHYYVSEVHTGLSGPLVGLSNMPRWPLDTIAPLGRLAEWDQRSNLARTIDRALILARKWNVISKEMNW